MSQTQELSSIYRRLDKHFGLDFNNLIYGIDGFFWNNYPKVWNRDLSGRFGCKAPETTDKMPDFNGDPVYSETLWGEFADWLLKTKNINISWRK